jgi:SAM-dependent methyltransferase
VHDGAKRTSERPITRQRILGTRTRRLGATSMVEGRDDGGVRLFDAAAEQYDAARPSYPAAVYNLLESRTGALAAKTIADGGAGTGIVARQLLERDAAVVAFDPGPGVLRQAMLRTPSPPAVIAEAEAVPIRAHVLDMVCFGQSWHWVDQVAGTEEMSRLLKPGGWWTAWWSHPWADEEAWFDQFYGLLESACPGVSRHQRNVDWCAEAIAAHGTFQRPERHVVPWVREVTVKGWLTDLSSHSYVIERDAPERTRLLAAAESILSQQFPGGTMQVPFQTRVWMAQRA